MALEPYVTAWDGKRYDVAVAGNDEKEVIWGHCTKEGFLELGSDGLIRCTRAGVEFLWRKGLKSAARQIEQRMELREARDAERIAAARNAEAVETYGAVLERIAAGAHGDTEDWGTW